MAGVLRGSGNGQLLWWFPRFWNSTHWGEVLSPFCLTQTVKFTHMYICCVCDCLSNFVHLKSNDRLWEYPCLKFTLPLRKYEGAIRLSLSHVAYQKVYLARLVGLLAILTNSLKKLYSYSIYAVLQFANLLLLC